MHRGAVLVVLVATLSAAGCVGAPTPGTPVPDSPTTPVPTETTTPTSTPAPLRSLPSPARCLTDAAPRPERVDGVEPSAYPEPPADSNREAVVGWIQSFETAYFRNQMLADASGDDDTTLARVSAYAEVRAVNRTSEGYTVRFSDSGATNFESGIHGDYWSDVGYVVTETYLVRVPLENREDAIRASAGTVVVDCR